MIRFLNLLFKTFLQFDFHSHFQGDDSKKGKKKKSTDLIELPIDEHLPGNTEAILQQYREEEVDFYFSFKFNKINLVLLTN